MQGCPNLVDGKGAYCAEHKKQYNKDYDMFRRADGHAEHYDKRWRRIRKAYVQAHPLCERCLKRGRYVKGDEVHHIVPVLEGGTNDVDNLMNLCKKCHAEVHAELGTRSHNRSEYKY